MLSGKIIFGCFDSIKFYNDEIDDVHLLLASLDMITDTYFLKKQSEYILPDKLELEDITMGTLSIPVEITWTLYFKNKSDWTAFQIIR